MHPAIGREYDVWIGGIAYTGKCKDVVRFGYHEPDHALCEYMFKPGGPGSSNTFYVPVDSNGNQL